MSMSLEITTEDGEEREGKDLVRAFLFHLKLLTPRALKLEGLLGNKFARQVVMNNFPCNFCINETIFF